MDFEWVAIGFSDFAIVALAFGMGLLSRAVGLPPMVGFLLAGFVLNAIGVESDELIRVLSDLGITLLLFTVGLKLNLGTLIRPQVWAVTSIHITVIAVAFAAGLYGLAGLSSFFDVDFRTALLIAFALSFSSTVYVVKVLEDRGEFASLHGQIAVGILLMQDVAAAVFLAVSKGDIPSMWAISLLALIPLRPLLHKLLDTLGHGELLVLFGFLLALGGAELFEVVGVKGDLGALILGLLIASHTRADELGKVMLGFKDLFLLGFFLSVGMSGPLTLDTLWLGLLLTPFIFLKSGLFYLLLTGFRLRARTALLSSINLTNYSEFGLIVAAIGVGKGWLGNEWLLAIAVALSFSFAIAAVLNIVSEHLYTGYRHFWQMFQRRILTEDDRPHNLGGARIAVIGMGGIGTGAYDMMRQEFGDAVVGIDIDPVTVEHQQASGRNVICGDPSDADFWDRVRASHTLETVMLALPRLNSTEAVLGRLSDAAFTGYVAATARFPDEAEDLHEAGATTVFNMYAEAGTGYASHVSQELSRSKNAAAKAD